MRPLIISFIIALLFSSCNVEDGQLENRFEEGTYSGKFIRNWPSGQRNTATITMTFEDNKWSGSSNIPKFPALCRGTYSITGNKITFQNECPWTAEFDWSLILLGEFTLEKSGKELEFSNYNRSATFTDHYKLIKE
ncbi:hypothetical protein ACFPIK_03585 [Algoriphagus aquatilis]|uniref:Lipocalin-like domain-containing protein n=1 Tax=Algoriphagus aquatilis TaxID=490186 RepID=A0ABW0BUF5_9BACT